MARKINKPSTEKTQLDLQLDIVTALYIRVSTVKQADEGFGLEAQRAELDAYCKGMGWNVAENHIYEDKGVSGKSTDRPRFQAMMQAAKDGHIQRIVTVKLDRIARNLKDLLITVDTLKAFKCALVVKKEQFDTSTPQGMFVLQMLGAVGELERSMISERVQGGRIENAKEGGYNGGNIALGYEYTNGVFTVNPGEAYWVREVFTRFLTGESLNAIARSLNEAGATTKKGGKWYAMTVSQTLINGTYAGISQWDGLEAEAGNYPTIISKDDYEAAHKRLQAMRKGQRVDLVAA
jgi:site-specific DNA recombinase